MDMQPRIKTLSLLMCLFNMASFLFIDYTKEIMPQMFFYVPIILITFLIIYFFYKGRNWARILIIIGSIFNLVFLLGAIVMYAGFFRRTLTVLDGAFSVYLLLFLNKETTKAFFKNVVDVSSPKPKRHTGIKIGLIVIAVIALIIAGGVALFSKAKSSMKDMDICIEDLNSGSVKFLTKDGSNTQPSFSKDGEKVVFVHTKDLINKKSSSELKILSLRDESITTILEDGNHNYSPSWSPDANSIVFASRHDGQTDIWQLNLNDNSKKKISQDGTYKGNPVLSPDGKWILFMQKPTKDGIDEIYLLSSAGGEEVRLTNTTNFLEEPKNPTWSPDSNEIIYSSLVTLIITDLQGQVVGRINLAGLNNIMGVFCDPKNSDTIYFKARPAQEASFNVYLYRVSRKTGMWEIVRKASFFEIGYNISSNGDKLVYAKPNKK